MIFGLVLKRKKWLRFNAPKKNTSPVFLDFVGVFLKELYRGPYTMANHHLSPPLGIVFLKLFPSI